MSKTKTNHALNNAIANLEEMVKNYEIGSYIESQNVTTNEDEEKLEEIRQSILDSALSVQFRNGWYSDLYHLKGVTEPIEFKILLSWGGPALRVIGEIEENYAVNPKLQYQDWGTPWTDLDITEDQQDALNWFCNCFYFGS
tara:strand:+ start:87 stop:509 length:423 start_codon:yes stop_codon:yes gene_type:complete